MLRKVFVNNSSAHIKLSKTQLYEIGLKTGLPLMKNEFKPLAKSVSIALGLTAAVPATDTAIQKKDSWIWIEYISNEEMDDIMKIVKSFEKSGLLVKGVSKSTKNEAKRQSSWFLDILLGIFVRKSVNK